MGHLLVSTLAKMRTRLAELTLEADGVDGKSIYIYGEVRGSCWPLPACLPPSLTHARTHARAHPDARRGGTFFDNTHTPCAHLLTTY
jgi:hypothetical protein